MPGAALAQSTPDDDPPKVKVWGDTDARCDGPARVRLEVRVTDASSTNTIVRVDGRDVRRSTRKRFAARVTLNARAHLIRAVSRDAGGRRFVFTLRLNDCS
jgi:hypothetical protein